VQLKGLVFAAPKKAFDTWLGWPVCLSAVDLAQEGKYLTLRNAKIDMYRGSMRLAVDQWGKVEALEGSAFKPKVGGRGVMGCTLCLPVRAGEGG
jgi:hypothetical protein